MQLCWFLKRGRSRNPCQWWKSETNNCRISQSSPNILSTRNFDDILLWLISERDGKTQTSYFSIQNLSHISMIYVRVESHKVKTWMGPWSLEPRITVKYMTAIVDQSILNLLPTVLLLLLDRIIRFYTRSNRHRHNLSGPNESR